MKKLALRLLVVILSIYVAGSVFPLLASSDHAPAPTPTPAPPPAPTPAPPPRGPSGPPGPAQHVIPATQPGGCGGGGCGGYEKDLITDDLVATSAFSDVEAKKLNEVGENYAAAEGQVVAKIKAKYGIKTPGELGDQLLTLDNKIAVSKAELAELNQMRRSGVTKTGYTLEPIDDVITRQRQDLKGLQDQRKKLASQTSDLKSYNLEVASARAKLTADKQQHIAAIKSLVRKAITNAKAKMFGAKLPDDATSSFDIEAYQVPSSGAIVNKLFPG